MYYIKRITMSGEKVDTSSIDLYPGVNILHGPSNTGKSYAAECIDYMMGSEETRIDDNKGYNKITIEIDVDGSTLTMSRNLNDTVVHVNSNVKGIDSGEYALNGNNRISHVWLKLMGINTKHRINKSAHCQREELSNRAFDQIFVIKEKKIDSEGSVLLPSEHSREPVAKSALLFLITGEDYDDGKDYDKPDIHKAKKEAIVSFADEQLEAIKQKEDDLDIISDVDNPSQIEDRMYSLLSEIDHTESEIQNIINENKIIGSKIYDIDKELTEYKVLENRYKSLQSQYRSDLKRLTFMVEGEELINNTILHQQECPFCGNYMNPETEESCVKAAKFELERLYPKITDLKSVQKNLLTEISIKEEQRKTLQQKMNYLEEKVQSELQPLVDKLRNELLKYSNALSILNKKAAYESVSNKIRENLNVYKSKPDPPVININQLFGETFLKNIHSIIDTLLIECKFDNYHISEFDIKKFDIKVNNTKKKSFGQGFRAFLNVILSIGIQEYLKKYGKYRPNIFVLDSPILSLKEDIDYSDLASESMKSALFKYLINNPCAEQIIIIENELPPIDYKSAHLIKYSKGHGFWKTNPM